MSIVRGVYEGLTAVIYGFMLDIALKVLLIAGFTDVIYDLLQLIITSLWMAINMFGWGGACIVNRGLCRLSTIYRYMILIVPTIMAISYISYLMKSLTAAALLFLISVSLVLGLSVINYVGAYILDNQFRGDLGRAGAVISIIATIMWLTLIPSVVKAGVVMNALGNALLIMAIMRIRRRYAPTVRRRG